MRHVYNVGEKIMHEAFGEGLVVDVRRRNFYDILEVAFGDGVRKITSIHPQIQPMLEDGADDGQSTHGRKKTEKTSRSDPGAETADVEGNGRGTSPTEVADPTRVPVDTLTATLQDAVFCEPDIVRLDRASFSVLGENNPPYS